MKFIKWPVFILILLLNNVIHANAYNPECETSRVNCDTPLPSPPKSSLKMTKEDINRPLKISRVTKWDIRAIVAIGAGVFEFDQQANVINSNGEPMTGYLVEFLNEDNKPLWKGNDKVYYWYRPERDTGDNFNDQSLLTAGDGIFIDAGNRICPAKWIAEEYTAFEIDYAEYYLDGNCTKATRKKIGKNTFWIYPINEEQDSFYWSIQQIKDPIKPMYDADGDCLLYCDKL
ncbi:MULTISPECIES: hypothetical protein [Entomomonas]|uniref:Uncharacterized protein n=1 Tax=Entomomonas asaccharolytica TaxID=2785331 RepID=A0A974NI33_9GAMM|nr:MULTISPECIES: hypothetical protein [Entomomonas]QQP86889.1 hypothetical protein JHT90_06500 [Entomomonas asaccharolytica]UYZ83492.1 hypothetical protein MTZ49_12950 [Entomomonas sp. E2T0]